jgi:hypothetical protein
MMSKCACCALCAWTTDCAIASAQAAISVVLVRHLFICRREYRLVVTLRDGQAFDHRKKNSHTGLVSLRAKRQRSVRHMRDFDWEHFGHCPREVLGVIRLEYAAHSISTDCGIGDRDQARVYTCTSFAPAFSVTVAVLSLPPTQSVGLYRAWSRLPAAGSAKCGCLPRGC